MEMVELDIEMDSDLIARAQGLALEYFGDNSDASLAQVLEVAFAMRCLWSRSVRHGQEQTEEAVSSWQFPAAPVTEEDSSTVRRWLFGR